MKKLVKKNRKKIKKIYSVIFHVCVGAEPPLGGMMKLCTFVDPLDVMNHTTFHHHMMNILRASRGRKTRFAIEMHMALTTLPCTSALASDDNSF
jgi:hypothetical protein